MKNPVIIACIKALLFPRYLTPYDLLLLTDTSQTEKDAFIRQIVNATLERISNPIAKTKGDSLVLQTENINNWFKTIAILCENFTKINMNDVAWALLSQWLSTYLFCLSNVHARRVLPKQIVKILPLKVSEDVITKLANVPAFLREIMKNIGFIRSFMVALTNLLLALRVTSGDIESIQKPFAKYILSPEKYLETIGLMSDKEILTILPTIAFLSEAISVTLLQPIEKDARERMEKLKTMLKNAFRIISDKLSNRKYDDLAVWITKNLLRLLLDSYSFVDVFKIVGEKILNEKLRLLGINSSIFLKIPPDLHAFIFPKIPPALDALTELSPNIILFSPLETIEIIQVTFNEIRFFLRYSLFEKPLQFINEFYNARRDPLASFGIYFLLGIPEIFLFDTMIIFLASLSEKSKNIAKIFSEKLAQSILEQIEIAKKLKNTLRNICIYLLARTLFHLNARISPDIEELLKTAHCEKFLNSHQKLNEIVENELGFIPRKEAPDVSMLFT